MHDGGKGEWSASDGPTTTAFGLRSTGQSLNSQCLVLGNPFDESSGIITYPEALQHLRQTDPLHLALSIQYRTIFQESNNESRDRSGSGVEGMSVR